MALYASASLPYFFLFSSQRFSCAARIASISATVRAFPVLTPIGSLRLTER